MRMPPTGASPSSAPIASAAEPSGSPAETDARTALTRLCAATFVAYASYAICRSPLLPPLPAFLRSPRPPCPPTRPARAHGTARAGRPLKATGPTPSRPVSVIRQECSTGPTQIRARTSARHRSTGSWPCPPAGRGTTPEPEPCHRRTTGCRGSSGWKPGRRSSRARGRRR